MACDDTLELEQDCPYYLYEMVNEQYIIATEFVSRGSVANFACARGVHTVYTFVLCPSLFRIRNMKKRQISLLKSIIF